MSQPEESDVRQLLKTTPVEEQVALSDYGATAIGNVEAEAENGTRQRSYFSDGQRVIDFVLVYAQAEEEVKKELSDEKQLARERYFANLRAKGVELEEESEHLRSNTLTYVKVHAPFAVLTRQAEDIGCRMPLPERQPPLEQNWSAQMLQRLRLPNLLANDVPNAPVDHFSCPFKRSKLASYLGHDDPDTFFSATMRQRIVYEILQNEPYGDEQLAEVGLGRLLEADILIAAYPLHDGDAEPPPGLPTHLWNRRQVLHEYWARWGCWYKYQPLAHIREYFGEKIALYFAWLGFYTAWLLPAAVVGVLVFIYGLATMHTNTPQREVCASQHVSMCRLCEVCPNWTLADTCQGFAIGYLFDNSATVFSAVFTALWAVTFLEFWKRTSSTLAYQWDCLGFEEEEERPRPQYVARCKHQRENPVTRQREPHFPDEQRLPRLITGFSVVILMIAVVLIFIVGVILYRIVIALPLTKLSFVGPNSLAYANATGAVLNLLLIIAMGELYQRIARALTEWEMHRTPSDFENQFIFKVFLFEFFNNYSSIIYVAFFKGKFVGYPGNYVKVFGLRNEMCGEGGSCMLELAIQMVVIMIGKQAISNVNELVLPKLKSLWTKIKLGFSSEDEHKPSAWEADFELCENEGLLEEYLEMIIQFGFITVFVAAFPLAPVFALLNNWIEIRLDARKLVVETRRPVAEKAGGIGVWFTILEVVCQMAVISNAFLIAFTSDFLPRSVYYYDHDWSLDGYVNFTLSYSANSSCFYRDFRDANGKHTPFYWRLIAVRLAFVIVFEHVVFFISKMIELIIPDVPEDVENKIKRERYLAKLALNESAFEQ